MQTIHPIARSRAADAQSDCKRQLRPGSRRFVARSALAMMLAVAANAALAQAHTHETGQYVLQSSVVGSTDIAASTAREHGIEPGPGTGVLNVVVLKKDGPRREPIAAEIDAEIRNLLGASHSVDLKAVKRNGRISYVSSFAHAPAETLDFRISARPVDGGPTISLEFRERLGATVRRQ